MNGEINFSNRNELKEFIANNNYVLIRASASWCGPCKRISPYYIDHLSKLPSLVKRVYVDHDKHRDVSVALKVRAFPTFLFYNHGMPDVCLTGSNIEQLNRFFAEINNKIYI